MTVKKKVFIQQQSTLGLNGKRQLAPESI